MTGSLAGFAPHWLHKALLAACGLAIPLACSGDDPGGPRRAQGEDCGPGRAWCGECTDTGSHLVHCGGCDNPCTTGEDCVSGACTCLAGLSSCNGTCVETNSDPAHCGGCNQPCEPGLFCSNGACSETCAAGLEPCGASCVDVSSSPSHCGGCNLPCQAGQTCAGGACQCSGGRVDCGAGCTDTNQDTSHCGGCNLPCDNGEVCSGGQCTPPSTGTGGASGTGGTTGAGGTGGTGTGGSGTGGGSGECEADACPMATGLTYACKKRFALGVNYAWRYFGGDFGGIALWEQQGVSQDTSGYSSEIAAMSNNGVSVIRWWMFPELRSSGLTFDAAGDPSGFTGSTVNDIQAALSLAETHDVYLVLTLFSFDNFRSTRTVDDVFVRGLSPMVRSSTRRAKLIENIVRKAAQAVAQSPNSHRLLGWDVINEPEWAVAEEPGVDQGDQFDPNNQVDPVTLTEMKALINESLAVLKQETPWALRSVGWAAAKWRWAFTDVTEVEFHQPHIYGWVHEYWPYTQSPTQLGYTGKPTVMGEFYLSTMPLLESSSSMATYSQMVNSWYDNGYAGAWAWQYAEDTYRANLNLIETFADSKGCPVRF